MNHLLLLTMIFLQATCFGQYYSQCSQDKIANERYFKNKRGGFFVDIGAHDGITYSNTAFFEKNLGWKGVCVEPLPEKFSELKKNRSCICVQGCITNKSGYQKFLKVPGTSTEHVEMLSGLKDSYHPNHMKRMENEISQFGGKYEEIDVKCYLLNDILENNGIKHVDFLSIDTEGGEFEIISSIDFSKIQVDVISVEDNYGDARFIPYLSEKGFNFIDRLTGDLLFVNKNFKY